MQVNYTTQQANIFPLQISPEKCKEKLCQNWVKIDEFANLLGPFFVSIGTLQAFSFRDFPAAAKSRPKIWPTFENFGEKEKKIPV